MTKNKGNLNPPQPSSAPLSQARGCVSKPMRHLLGKNNSRVGRTWAKQVYKEGWMVGEMEARTPSVASSNPIGEDSNPCKGTVDKGGLSQLRSPSLPFPNKISLKPLLEIQKEKRKKPINVNKYQSGQPFANEYPSNKNFGATIHYMLLITLLCNARTLGSWYSSML